ncbi:uncharacterized protein LOC116950533 isoform X2 [Petromyzon marinus]|uniref:uncharacterized protein LOC116950533 isoform X2 n=1 Tax=Petromyzon marinus TaxID=7757 RepID=UPI003F7061BE
MGSPGAGSENCASPLSQKETHSGKREDRPALPGTQFPRLLAAAPPPPRRPLAMASRRGCPSDGGEVGFCGDRGGFLGDGGDPGGFRGDDVGAGCAGPESVREFTQHARDVLRNLQELRARSALTDVTLRAGGRDFPAHSAVLAACSGFFYSVLAESRGPAGCGGGGGGTRVLPLPGVDPCGLEVLLDFMYTSRLPLSLDSVLGVMAAARYLHMEHVVRTCEAFLDSPQALPERLRNLDPNIHGSFPPTLLCGINPGFPLGGPLAPPPLFLRGPPSPPPQQQPQQHHPMGPPPRFTFPDPPPPAAPRRWASAPAPAAADPASPSGGGPAAEGPSEGAGPPGAPSARRVSEPSSPPDGHREVAPAGGQVKSCNWKKRRFLVQTTSTSSTSSSPPSSPSSSSSSPTSDGGAGGGDACPPTPPSTVAAAAAAAAAAPSTPPTRLSPTPEAKVMTTLSPVTPRGRDGRDEGAPALFPWDLGPIVGSAVAQPPPHPSSSALASTPASSSPTPPRATCVAAFDVMKLEGGSEARGPAGEWGAPPSAAISGIHQLTHFKQLVDRLKEESGGFKRPELGLPVAHSADSPPPEGDGHAASPGLAGSPGLAMSPGLTNSPSHDGPHDPTCVRACGACGLGFPEEGALRRHIARIHADDKPYKCDTCHAAFRYKGNLSSHRTVHSGEKPYRCTVCGAQFNRPANLKTHTRIHSGEKPYKCDTCGACFVQVAHLRAHVLIHTGEKPYPCETCGTRFRHLQTLKSHIRIHTGEKPYHCESCDLHFRHKSQLRLHLRQKHGAITNTKVKYQVLDAPEGGAGLTGEGPTGAAGGGGAPLADDAGDAGRPSPATRGPEAGPVAGAPRQSPDAEPPAAPLGFPRKRSSSGGGGGGSGGAASSDDDDSGLSMNGDPESPVAGAGRAPCGLRWV